MSDLISRKAALRTDCFGDGHEGLRAFHSYHDYRLMREYLESLPSAEPEWEKGKWLMHSDFPDRLICSECGAQFDVWHWESKQMHFCPNCGKGMRGIENETD